MRRPGGTWGPVTLDGPRSIVVEGEEFRVPEGATLKLVRAGQFYFLHVRAGRYVYVLSPGLGQLIEEPIEALSRATPTNWRAIEGEFVRPH